MQFSNVRDAVKAYTERGFRVVPLFGVDPVDGGCRCGSNTCKPRDWGKHEPPGTDGLWKEGHTFRLDDFAEGCNVALAMGPWKGGRWLVALDLDGTDDPGEFFPAMPPTLTQQTPRGSHLLYTVPEYTPLGNYVDVFKTRACAFQLDLRYARGRIVVAPSRGGSGDYRWTDWRAPVPLPNHALASILAQRRSNNLPVAERWVRGSKEP